MSKIHLVSPFFLIILYSPLSLSAGFFDGAVGEITGYTSEDFLTGRIKWDQLIHPEDAPLKKKKVKAFHSDSAERDSGEYRIIRKNGETRWILDKFQKKYDYEKKMEGS